MDEILSTDSGIMTQRYLIKLALKIDFPCTDIISYIASIRADGIWLVKRLIIVTMIFSVIDLPYPFLSSSTSLFDSVQIHRRCWRWYANVLALLDTNFMCLIQKYFLGFLGSLQSQLVSRSIKDRSFLMLGTGGSQILNCQNNFCTQWKLD